MSRNQQRALLIAGIVGLLVIVVLSRQMRDNPAALGLFFNPAFQILALLLVVGVNVALIVWASARPKSDRMALVAGTISAGVIGAIVQTVAPTVGWYVGTGFRAPVWIQGLLYGGAFEFVLFFLALYRRVARWNRWAALAVYALILAASAAATPAGDQYFDRIGVMHFQNGYTGLDDLVYGFVVLALPLALYELLRPRADSTANQARARPTPV